MSALGEMAVSEGVARSRRLPSGARALDSKSASAREIGVLASIGVLTAVARGLFDVRLGIPGHSILLVVAPFVFGLACVPRRKAGALMGVSALAAAGVLRAAGVRGIGAGAVTSLVLTAALLEAALRLASSSRAVYLWCIGAGLASNLAAFTVRLATKCLGAAPADALRPVAAWWPRAIWTYPLSGAVAGLIAAFLLFRLHQSRGADAARQEERC